MKEKEDIRALECEIIESKITYVENIIKEEIGVTDTMPMRDKIRSYQNYVLGAHDIASLKYHRFFLWLPQIFIDNPYLMRCQHSCLTGPSGGRQFGGQLDVDGYPL